MMAFAFGRYPVVDAFDVSASDGVVGLGTADAVISVLPGGTIRKTEQGSPTTLGTWLLSGSASDYEVMVSGSSAGTFTGTLDTWLDPSASPAWGCSRSTSGTSSFSGTISFRRAGHARVLDSAAITLTATFDL